MGFHLDYYHLFLTNMPSNNKVKPDKKQPDLPAASPVVDPGTAPVTYDKIKFILLEISDPIINGHSRAKIHVKHYSTSSGFAPEKTVVYKIEDFYRVELPGGKTALEMLEPFMKELLLYIESKGVL